MIKYFCDICKKEMKKEEICSLIRFWRETSYVLTDLNERGVGKIQKDEGVKQEEKILCPACLRELWKIFEEKQGEKTSQQKK